MQRLVFEGGGRRVRLSANSCQLHRPNTIPIFCAALCRDYRFRTYIGIALKFLISLQNQTLCRSPLTEPSLPEIRLQLPVRILRMPEAVHRYSRCRPSGVPGISTRKAITPPATIPARAPCKLVRFQNREKSTSGPNAEPKPARREGYDVEYGAVGIPCQEDADNSNGDNGEAGCHHGSGGAHLNL